MKRSLARLAAAAVVAAGATLATAAPAAAEPICPWTFVCTPDQKPIWCDATLGCIDPL